MQSFKQFVAEREETPDHGTTVQGIHYSHASGLTHLDGARSGTGISGRESERLKWTKDDRIKKRTYFYNHEASHGVLPPTHEAGLGPHVHSATLHKVFDPDKASPQESSKVFATRDKHVYDGEDHANAYERAVLDHGYAGHTNRGMTVMLGHDHVPVKYEGHRADLLKKTA